MSAQLASLLIPHLGILALGLPISYFLFNSSSLFRKQLSFFIAASYLVGELLVVLILLCSSHLLGSFSWNALPILSALLWTAMVFHLIRDKEEKAAFNFRSLLPIILIGLIALPNIITSYYDPLVAWDARSIWFFHGKAFFYDNAIDLSYLKNELYTWSHPDYPPLIPLLATYHAHFLGEWNDVLNKSFLFAHWFFSLLLLFTSLRLLKIPTTISILIAIAFQVIFAANAIIGYADSVYGANLVIGILLFTKAQQHERSLLLLGILMFASASLSKTEGLYLASLYLALYLFADLRNSIKQYKLSLSLVSIFAVISSLWYGYCLKNNIAGDYSFSITSTSFQRLQTVFAQGISRNIEWYGAGVMIFVALVLIFAIYDLLKNGRFKLPLVYLLCLFPVILLIYASSPIDLRWHIENSFHRVSGIVVMLCLVIVGLIWSSSSESIKGDRDR